MADVRLPRPFIMVVIDGIYTLQSLDAFRSELRNPARLRGLL